MREQISVARKAAFGVGTGRSGTHFMARLLGQHHEITSYHERNPLLESYYRFCQWHNLPVDRRGFLDEIGNDIAAAIADRKIFFEASAYLSLSIADLYQEFDARFIFLVRHPLDVVNSLWSKGLYEKSYAVDDPNLVPGYQPHAEFHHYFSRISPKGEEFIQWNARSRIGKVAWFWRIINEQILEAFDELPSKHVWCGRLEDFDYLAYVNMVEFLGTSTEMNERDFNRIVNSRPGKRPRSISLSQWDEKEAEEFETEVADMASRLGYEYRVSNLREKQKRITGSSPFVDNRL